MKDTYKKGSYEDKMTRQAIADSNKQTKGPKDPNYIKSRLAKKMGGEKKSGPIKWSEMSSAQKKKWLQTDKEVAGKKYYTNVQGIRMEDKRDATMKALDRQKAKRLY